MVYRNANSWNIVSISCQDLVDIYFQISTDTSGRCPTIPAVVGCVGAGLGWETQEVNSHPLAFVHKPELAYYNQLIGCIKG